ncbi:MAG TPA: DUF6386 family protein, partial [Chloroflexia bacterium]|nr:DUF6386 family protein [Chloroflexia bacterium]
MEEIVTILTDAATVGIFDPKQLIPHFNDEAGWWAAPTPELQELNKGTLMVVYLGADGYYDLHIHDGILRSNGLAVTAKVRCSSGQLFIGP